MDLSLPQNTGTTDATNGDNGVVMGKQKRYDTMDHQHVILQAH